MGNEGLWYSKIIPFELDVMLSELQPGRTTTVKDTSNVLKDAYEQVDLCKASKSV